MCSLQLHWQQLYCNFVRKIAAVNKSCFTAGISCTVRYQRIEDNDVP